MRAGYVVLVLIAAIATAALAQTPNAPPPAPPPPLPSITLPPELDRVLRDYERHWRAGDEQALATLFTADGFVPTRSAWVRGSEGIRKTYESFSGDLRLRALAYATGDTVGYIVGAYRYGDGGNDGGKFVLALRRAPGGPWLIAADIDQSNRP